MITPNRYLLLALLAIVLFHSLLRFSHSPYSQATSLSSIASKFRYPHPEESQGAGNQNQRRANAVFVVLARNHEVQDVVESIRQMEDRFNRHYKYPYVFLNEVEFSEDFKQRTSRLTDAPMSYGIIPHGHWFQPDHIDEEKATKARLKMVSHNVIYGGSVSYRNMCRFNSGFFFQHELLKDYRYYWRIEPGVQYFCDLDYDPFLFMQDNNKVYGFTISLLEFQETIQSLWPSVTEFIDLHPQYLAPNNSLPFISDDNGKTYNRCHFWSNFEIGDLELWRSEAYTKFFEFLDAKGGFYYERWGDAPVHSIAAALFARQDQIHWFHDIGYKHAPFTACPRGNAHKKGHCWCNPHETFTSDPYSCTPKWLELTQGIKTDKITAIIQKLTSGSD